MGISALSLLRVVESADRRADLDGWASAFSQGIRRSTGALVCQLLQVRDGGARLDALGAEDAAARPILTAGHRALDAGQRRRIYQAGAMVVSLEDLYGAPGGAPATLRTAMGPAGIGDVIGLVAAPGVSVGLFMPSHQSLDLRRRQLLMALAHHVGASVALRSALNGDPLFDGELPARLQGALSELDRRRRWARQRGDADDAASALSFLSALASEGFAVVHETRRGGRQRLLAVRVKDPSARALRVLDAGERRVLEELSNGRSLQEIAFDLGVAEATVSGRIARIRAKIGIDPRSQVVRAAGVGDEPS